MSKSYRTENKHSCMFEITKVQLYPANYLLYEANYGLSTSQT